MIEIVKQVKFQSLFVEAHIADLHFGVIDPLTEYNILKEQFLDVISEMNVLDIVCIEGDIFDHKFMASSEVIMYINMFIQDLVNICKMKNATLILISGTSSHDSDQLKMFYHLSMLNDVDVRVITEMKFVFVRGKKILCIPELYNKGEDYYNSFLVYGGLYDACYMHGCFKGAIRNKNERDLNSSREPVFDISDFGSCAGPIISGHNHIRSQYETDFYYCGSPIRWTFGDEKDKGFLILIHDIKTRHYHVHFEPIVSFRYDTINLDSLIRSDPNTIIQYIDQIKRNGIDKLRIIFTINDADKIALLKSYYRNIKDIKIETNFEKNKIEENLNKIDEMYKKEYSYLFDNNLSYEEKLIQYMNSKDPSYYWDIDNYRSFMQELAKL